MNADEYELERETSAPIDMLEYYFSAHGWTYERNGEEEIVATMKKMISAMALARP